MSHDVAALKIRAVAGLDEDEVLRKRDAHRTTKRVNTPPGRGRMHANPDAALTRQWPDSGAGGLLVRRSGRRRYVATFTSTEPSPFTSKQ